MWRRIRAILLAHSIASWLGMLALWAYMLGSAHLRVPNTYHNPQFWLILAFTNFAAPLVLPALVLGSVHDYYPDMFVFVALPTVVYILVAIPFLIYWWQRQNAKTARQRRQANQCLACGYDLRASPQRCPECGAVPQNTIET